MECVVFNQQICVIYMLIQECKVLKPHKYVNMYANFLKEGVEGVSVCPLPIPFRINDDKIKDLMDKSN